MKSKIIQISTVIYNTIFLYALCEDGTVWYCQPENTASSTVKWIEVKE